MTNEEFSNQFDILYNNIASNQAPGLDEYEKSVFLTKAQDEIIKSYFNPQLNKVHEGYDGSERRQIDFSMIMKSMTYQPLKVIDTADYPFIEGSVATRSSNLSTTSTPLATTATTIPSLNFKPTIDKNEIFSEDFKVDSTGTIIGVSDPHKIISSIDNTKYVIDKETYEVLIDSETQVKDAFTINPFLPSFFDMRDETKSIILEDDILMLINEYVEVSRSGNTVRLMINPINYMIYTALMSKPFKRPVKGQAWRLMDNSNNHKRAEIVVGVNDIIKKYVIRYIKRPRPIILAPLDDVSIDGYVGYDSEGNLTKDISEANYGVYEPCELDPILHEEILQRGVEFAKAVYTGDLNTSIALGTNSQTNIGMIGQSQSQ